MTRGSEHPVTEHSVMWLFIGKNHDEKIVSAPVQSIFRLTGNNEDALNYALGFLLARDAVLCAELMVFGIESRRFRHSEGGLIRGD